jgi:hypothetical protein
VGRQVCLGMGWVQPWAVGCVVRAWLRGSALERLGGYWIGTGTCVCKLYDSAQRSSAPPRTEYNMKQCNIQYGITI